VKTDGTVFAHIHPNGSVSMAALMLAEGMPADMQMAETVRSTVSFPWGFPTPGQYRIFVQMKHGNTVETGVFDAIAVPPNSLDMSAARRPL
jgi:anti-sigma factor RsiW